MTLKPARFLDPKSDLVFKKIFGHHPDLIKSFLNGILPLPDDQVIETVEYLNPEQVPVIPTMKDTIVDVKCIDQYGRIFIVEMQMQWSANFSKRLLFGTSKAYIQQLDKGEDYESLCPVYGLGIVNDVFDKQSKDWFHHYRSINVQKPERVLEGLELIFIELPKFKPQTWQEKKMGFLWLRFLKEINEHLTDIPEEFTQNPELTKAMELAQESSYSKGELEVYDKYWDIISTHKTMLNDSFRAGLKTGREEGKTEGREEGEKLAKLSIAKNLISQGFDIEMIIQVTKLTKAEIEALL